MKLQKNFTQAKMNKDVDERLLPSGLYPDAYNIRVGTTTDGSLGVVQNIKGNYKLTNLNLTNALTIGGLEDGSNQKIYWLVASDTKDMVVEYDYKNSQTNILLQSSAGGVLNFSKTHRVTGITKVINGDSDKDLLAWTDDYNAPRCINIKRSKNYLLDGFVEDDISLIKAPPRYPLSLELQTIGEEFENNLEDKFFAFSWRYKYLDGEYSALASFTDYAFMPKEFNLDYQTMENKGMVNKYDNIKINFETGGKNVTDIELVYKESTSNTVFIIQSFNKHTENWGDNETKFFNFNNNKKYRALAEDELFRTYDNVPLKAKGLILAGNRFIFGNIEEGYDMVDNDGEKIKFDYTTTLSNETEIEQYITTTLSTPTTVDITFGDVLLEAGKNINFTVDIKESTYFGYFRKSYNFILNEDYNSLTEFVEGTEFISFMSNMTSDFISIITTLPYSDFDVVGGEPPESPSVFDFTPFTVEAVVDAYDPLSRATPSGGVITIGAPTTTYDGVTATWEFNDIGGDTAMVISDKVTGSGVKKSAKSNRTYEACLVYMDSYGRASLPISVPNNMVFVPQKYSANENKLKIEINHPVPAWADRFKVVVKQDKGDYHNVFTNVFYEDGIYRWIKLEGENRNKVKAGDNLIVKSDMSGRLVLPIKIKVLEVTQKPKDFIEGNKLSDGTTNLIEEAGLYMKIKPVGINMNFNSATVKTFQGGQGRRYPSQCATTPAFANAEGLPAIKAGSRVSIYIKFEAFGSIGYIGIYDKQFVVQANYASVKEWFDAEVKNLGEFGQTFTRAGGDVYHRGAGWDFSADGSQFWVRAHRDGTASRDIYTTVKFEIFYTDGTVVFETEPEVNSSDIYYETSQVFDIVDGYHVGNLQTQTASQPAIIESNFFNCYSQGFGVESYRFKDAFNSNYLNIDLRPTMIATEEYKKVRRFADLSYGETYNENNNVNGLNEFNLSRANYKEDIDKNYGAINKLHSRENDIIVLQEDRVTKVLFGKDMLMNADGTSNITSIQDVLGQAIPYTGEYGISSNPEGFVYNGFYCIFPDVKRGAIMRLAADGLNEISKLGMNMYFKDKFKADISTPKIGGYDPYFDEYIISSTDETVAYSEDVKGWTSFYGYSPDMMIGMNNDFFSFKNGELYIHHSDLVPRNTFYGVQDKSKVSLMFNDNPSEIRETTNISLEGNLPWDTTLTSYGSSTDDFVRSTVYNDEFVKKEGIWFAYARRNEDIYQTDSKATYGIGTVISVSPTFFTVAKGANIVCGDKIVRGSDFHTVGVITNVTENIDSYSISVASTTGLHTGDFIIGVKNARIEGGNIKGYTTKVDLEIQTGDKVELYAVNTEVIKSNP